VTADQLAISLLELVRDQGVKQVYRALEEVDGLDAASSSAGFRTVQTGRGVIVRKEKRRPAATALERVKKMDLPTDTADAVVELARRFDNKTFMPTLGDITNFCEVYDIDQPASKSRAAAVPRVFSAIVAMDAEDIQILLDYGSFSGPSRPGPIADAIARSTART